jgi:cell division protein FtsW (lipid II flippase)
MLVLRRRRSTEYHRTVLTTLTARQRAHRQRFIRKATGWFVVALGGSSIAVKETWELTERNEWPEFVFLALLLVMIAIVGANTVLHAGRREHEAGHRDVPPTSS